MIFDFIRLMIITSIVGLLSKGIIHRITDIYEYFIDLAQNARHNRVPILSILLLAFYLSIIFTIFTFSDFTIGHIIIITVMIIISAVIWMFYMRRFYYDQEPSYSIIIWSTVVIVIVLMTIGHLTYSSNKKNTTISEDSVTTERELVNHILDKEIKNGKYYLYYGHDHNTDKKKVEVGHEEYYMYKIGSCYVR